MAHKHFAGSRECFYGDDIYTYLSCTRETIGLWENSMWVFGEGEERNGRAKKEKRRGWPLKCFGGIIYFAYNFVLWFTCALSRNQRCE